MSLRGRKLQDSRFKLQDICLFLFLATCILHLASCGWEPMYGGSVGSNGSSEIGIGASVPISTPSFQSVRAGLNRIEINAIRDAEGVYLRNALIDRFYSRGYPEAPVYTLSIGKIGQSTYDFDITVDSEATRRQLTVKTSMTLIDKRTSEVVLQRAVKASSSYDVLGSQFTTRVAEQDVLEASLDDLARQIEQQIVLYFKRH